jgi:predicted phosphoribosyltransferase
MDYSFRDRLDAGSKLAARLDQFTHGDGIVLGLARGGVVVGYAVAMALDLPLQPLIVRKVGAPHNPELAIGAVSETGQQWLDLSIVRAAGATEEYIRHEVQAQVAEARRREHEYHTGAGLGAVRARPAIVVDDGIATGSTALVAVRSARDLGASQVILAIPVAPPQAVDFLQRQVDSLVVLMTPEPFMAVGLHYKRFDQVSDEGVIAYLKRAASRNEAES